MQLAAIGLLCVLLVAGCISVTNSRGLSVALQADPPVVFSKSSTLLHIDVDNQNPKTLSNVMVELFDTGLLRGTCSKFFDRLLPYEFQSVSCRLDAPQIDEASVQTEVNTRVSFDSEFSATHVFEVMDEDEYQRRIASGSYESAPRSYVYGDRNVAINAEFSEDPPIVLRTGKKYFVYFTITNAGDGFMSSINPGDFTVENDNILDPDCLPKAVLSPVGKQFQRIACEIRAPIGFLGGRDFRSSDFLIHLKYNYEVRNSLRINVIR